MILTRWADSNQIGLSKRSNPKLKNFVCWYLQKCHCIEISYCFLFFGLKASNVSTKLWIIPIKWGSWNVQIPNFKNIEIHKKPNVQKFRTLLFCFWTKSSVCHREAVSLSCCADSNTIGLSKCLNTKLENFVRCFFPPKSIVRHRKAVSLSRRADSSQITLSKCSNSLCENFVRLYLRKCQCTEISYVAFF